ncbi:MAG: ATP-binding protein [Acidimicrobiales bacterium]
MPGGGWPGAPEGAGPDGAGPEGAGAGGDWWSGRAPRHSPRLRRRHGGHPGRCQWRRCRDDRLFGGVAGCVARRLGIDVTLVRVALVIVTLMGGFGAVGYVVAWLLIPADGQAESIGARASRDAQGIVLSLAFVPALVVTLVVGTALHIGILTSFAWPFFACAAGVVLLWRNCDPEERVWLRQAAEPIVHLGTGSRRSWRRFALRFGVGFALLVTGLAVLAFKHPQPVKVLRPIGGAVLVVVAVVVLFGPWWLRLIRDLVAERQARARAEDRADMAARVHDSVLQTLAMIQRSSDQPQKVVQLARAQERELRAWLFEGEPPGTVGDGAASIAAGVQLIADEVERDHGVPVDVVTVGDCELDDRLRALLGATREATVNAAKWSGTPVISVFAEAEPANVSVFVRDRGCGFDPQRVAGDRRGIAESIQARMLRHGGSAAVRTAPGHGTEVELGMPLWRDR